MPLQPPYAKVLVAVNAGAPSSGGIVVPGAASIALTGENTSFWGSQRWEIYSYPVDFTPPAGWSIDANGVIFSTAVTPPTFSLPALAAATGWGKYMLRLTVNNGTLAQGLVDESTSLRMTSARGLRALGFNETSQFGGVREQFAAEFNATLRAIEAFAAGGGATLPRNNPMVEKTANYTLVASTDNGVTFTGAGPYTATLPASPTAGDEYVIANESSSNLTVAGNGNAFLIVGSSTIAPGQAVTFRKSTSANWIAL